MAASSTSTRKPSPRSRRSDRASPRSASAGSGGLGRGALRDLASRHGLRPARALGQHFLADPNLARRIVSLAAVEEGDRVVEVGAGLGSLTVALAGAGARVLAVELDRALAPALAEALAAFPSVRIEIADALVTDWPSVLRPGRWKMVSNLPYNIATPLLLEMLAAVRSVDLYLVMVQREVGERLVAGPGDPGYGAVSVKVALRAEARLLRRVPASVFWPQPRVESTLVELVPRPAQVGVDPGPLVVVVEEGFAERRKTMANALRRLGLGAGDAAGVLVRCGLDPRARAEQLSLGDFARVTSELLAAGALEGVV